MAQVIVHKSLDGGEVDRFNQSVIPCSNYFQMIVKKVVTIDTPAKELVICTSDAAIHVEVYI